MRFLYANDNAPGFRLINVDGTGEVIMPAWWETDPRREQLGGPALRRISPDGVQMAYAFIKSLFPEELDLPTSLWVAPLDGTEGQLLVTYTNEWFPRDPLWSPDSQQIAYRRSYFAGPLRDGLAIGAQELWVMDVAGENQRMVLSGEEIRRIESSTTDATVFRWADNGYIYFATHRKELYAVNPQNGSLYLLMSNVEPLALYSTLSPDGVHVVVRPDLPASVIAEAGLIPVEAPGPFEAWCPNGVELLYINTSTESNQQGIWQFNVLTGQKRRLLPGMPTAIHGLSPDGRYLAYQTDQGIFMLEVESGETWLIVADPLDPKNHTWTVKFYGWVPVR
jgi:Tol biopolymer transport system component